ncbi:MAG: GMC family oxidoreductase [Chlorobi bacterium]|nr:GMC family oxidoreductase [Chlorobiota bacterium]
MPVFDAVVIGSGAGAGPVIYELARAGFRVAVLEKGPWFRTADFRKDELVATRRDVYFPNLEKEFHVLSFTRNGRKKSVTTYEWNWSFWNGNMAGGATNIMSGYFQRMKPQDFKLLSTYGEIPGANITDWPVDYAEMEPYYTKVEKLIGVSGRVVAHRFQEPRSTPDFPFPPLRENIVASFIDRAAKELGYEVIPTPRAILSQDRDERKACYYSNYCGSYGCASDAKGSARVALLRDALKTGNVTFITNAHVYRLETDGHFRVKKARFITADGKKYAVEGKIFVVAAQAVESVRLLLLSKNKEFPEGLANNNGLVGKNILFSAGGIGEGEIRLDDYDEKTAAAIRQPGLFINRTLQSFYEWEDPETGKKQKGGIVDFLFEHANPVPRAIKQKRDGDRLVYGRELKQRIYRYFTGVRTLKFEIFTDWLPHDGGFVSLDKRHKDFRGFPVANIHIDAHPAQIRPGRFLARHAEQLLRQMGLHHIRSNVNDWPPSNLQAGGIRFGNDPRTSVLNKWCQAHEVENLFVTDGSFMPTGGSVPYTWTIYANSFRVADYIKREFAYLKRQ